MKFESEIVYRMPMTLNEWYIRREFEALNIKEIYKKEVRGMFDIEKIEAYYAELKAKKEEAVAVALAEKEAKVAEAFELAKEEIAKKVEAELVAEAEAPYKHDIELCESFLAEEKVEEEEVAEETAEQVGGEY